MNEARFFPQKVESVDADSPAFFGTATAIRVFFEDGPPRDYVIVGSTGSDLQAFVDHCGLRTKASLNLRLTYEVGVIRSSDLKLVDDEL